MFSQYLFIYFGTAVTGLPLFIQVSSDWRIRQKLVGLSTLRKSPDHQTLTAAMEKHYVEELKLDLTKLIAAMVDRASTNKAALDLLASEHGGLAFLRAYCNSHTLCHVGGNFESKELDSFFSAYRTLIMHQGGARDLMRAWLEEAPLTAAGIRWYVKWEQTAQVQAKDIMSMQEVLLKCKEKKYSEASAEKLLKMFDDKIFMAKVLVAAAAQVDAGKLFCQATYLLEGDSPLVFTAHRVFTMIDTTLVAGLQYPQLTLAADEAAAMSAAAIGECRARKEKAAKEEVDAELCLTEAKDAEAAAEAGAEKAKAAKAVERASGKLTKAKAGSKRAKDLYDKAISTEYGADYWFAVGMEGIKPGLDYYKNQFETDGGDMYTYKQALMASKVFDPMIVKDMNELQVSELIDGVAKFNIPGFDDEFVKNLKLEAGKLIKHAKIEFPWGEVDGAAAYDDRQRKVAADSDAAASLSAGTPSPELAWLDDCAERARRIWEWWRVKAMLPAFNYWHTAARLVVLIQTSSAPIERVFSQMRQILETIGTSASLAETLRYRLFRRCNHKNKNTVE